MGWVRRRRVVGVDNEGGLSTLSTCRGHRQRGWMGCGSKCRRNVVDVSWVLTMKVGWYIVGVSWASTTRVDGLGSYVVEMLSTCHGC